LANTSILSAERVAVLRGVVEVCVPVLVVSSSLGNEFSSGSGNKHSAVTWALRLRHVALQGPYYRAQALF
jgi:hypothetical protein